MFSLLPSTCYRLGTVVPCILYSYSQSLCATIPYCQVNPSTLDCDNCTSSQCGPSTTPCSQLNSTQCTSLSSRCQWFSNNSTFANHLLRCVDLLHSCRCAALPCSSITVRSSCTAVPQCQWSVAASYCLGVSLFLSLIAFISSPSFLCPQTKRLHARSSPTRSCATSRHRVYSIRTAAQTVTATLLVCSLYP